MKNKGLLFVAMLAVFSLALKLAVTFYSVGRNPAMTMEPDSLAYENTGIAFSETGRFPVSVDEPSNPQTVRTPGYPFLIGAVYRVFGRHRTAVIIFQHLLSCAVLFLCYLISVRLFPACRSCAVFAPVFLFFDLGFFYYSHVILSEMLFTFFLVLSVWAGLEFMEKKNNGYAFLTGLFLALDTLVRPVTYYIIWPVAAGFLIYSVTRGRGTSDAAIKCMIAVFVPWLLFVGGWRLRNHYAMGSSDISSIRGETIFSIVTDMISIDKHISLDHVVTKYGPGFHRGLDGLPTGEKSARLAERTKKYIVRHPVLLAQSCARSFVRLFFVPGEAEFLKYIGYDISGGGPVGDILRLKPSDYFRKWLLEKPAWFLLFSLYLVYLLVLYGLFIAAFVDILRNAAGNLLPHLFVWGVIVYVILITIPGYRAYVRFRVPLMPFIVLYSAYGLSAVLKRFGARLTSAGDL